MEKYTLPRKGLLSLFWHNLRVIYLVVAYRKMYAMYDKEIALLPGGETTASPEACLTTMMRQAEKMNLSAHKHFSLHITKVISIMTNQEQSLSQTDNKRLKMLIGIALGLGNANNRDDLAMGVALRKVITYWEVLLWLVMAGIVDEAFFKARFAPFTEVQIQTIKNMFIKENPPIWLLGSIPGLKLPS